MQHLVWILSHSDLGKCEEHSNCYGDWIFVWKLIPFYIFVISGQIDLSVKVNYNTILFGKQHRARDYSVIFVYHKGWAIEWIIFCNLSHIIGYSDHDTIRNQSRDVIYPVLKSSGFAKRSITKHEQLHLFSPMRIHFITFISYRNTFYLGINHIW